MQDFLLYSAIPGSGRLCPVPACPADSHCVIVYPPAIQIATLDLLNFIKNESWVPCKMQNGGVGPAEVISSLRGILPPSLQSLPPSRGEGLRAGEDTRPYGIYRNCPFFCRGRSQTGPPITDQLSPARQSQARLWNRISFNFWKARAWWPGCNHEKPLRFCAPGILLSATGTRPPLWGF